MTDELEQLLDGGEKHARTILLEKRERSLQGFYHLIGPETNLIIPTAWANDIQKQIVLLGVKEASRKIKATQALCVHEAWMLKLDTPNTSWHRNRALANLPRPSESPDRIEVVHLIAMDAATVKTRSLQILRDKPGGRIIALIDDKALAQSGDFSGRMVEGIIAAPEG